MSLGNWFVIVFGVLIGSSAIYQILVFLGVLSGQQPKWAEQLAEERLNAGWRIALIPIDDQGTFRGQQGSVSTLVWSLAGLSFIGGVVCLLAGKINLAIGMIAATPVIVGGLLIIRRIQVKQNLTGWQVSPAQCVDREVRYVVVATRGHGRACLGWMCRAICEFRHEGETFRVTPIVQMRFLGGEGWFWTEEAAKVFLGRAIDQGGKCELHVNPNNPRETILVSAMA